MVQCFRVIIFFSPPSQDNDETRDALQHWWRVAAFYSLRLWLAPVAEAAILLDRCLYLAEEGVSGVIAPVFEPSLSPRYTTKLKIENCCCIRIVSFLSPFNIPGITSSWL